MLGFRWSRLSRHGTLEPPRFLMWVGYLAWALFSALPGTRPSPDQGSIGRGSELETPRNQLGSGLLCWCGSDSDLEVRVPTEEAREYLLLGTRGMILDIDELCLHLGSLNFFTRW